MMGKKENGIRELKSALKLLKRENLQLKRKLEKAEMDKLTGMLTRQAGEARLYAELDRFSRERRFPISMVFVDGDNVKAINDRYGHKRGDLTIRAISDAIMKAKRLYDIAFRYGGDEFVVVLPDTGKNGAKDFSGRLERILTEFGHISRSDQTALSASIGAATLGVNQIGGIRSMAKMLLDIADKDMYKKKRAKKETRMAPT